MNKKQKKMLYRILITFAAAAALHFFPISGTVKLLLYLGLYIFIGSGTLKKTYKSILSGQIFDENFLMTIATLGAFALAIYAKTEDYDEAVAVMLFYKVGELFESCAVSKSRRSITELMDIRPDYANLEKDGKLEKVDPNEVKTGSIIIVNPGEKVPIDGRILEGHAALNTLALTGESQPQEANPGDSIVSGCISINGVLRIRTEKEFGESTVSKILELTENAGSCKSKSENFISKFSRIYTPAVCLLALLLASVPPLIRISCDLPAMWGLWIYRALIMLVISCPCALVISIPLSFFAGLGGASREGILIKGSNYIETLAKIKTVVFDKTGTLTQGIFEVSGVHHSTMEAAQLIECAALAESASSHPISKSLHKAYSQTIDRSRVKDIEEISGQGLKAVVDGVPVAVGNDKLMHSLGIEHKECSMTGTIVHAAIDGRYAGHIVISDMLKLNSAQAVKELKELGITKTVMLTGDNKKAAEQIAAPLGLDKICSGLLPDGKVEELKKLLKEQKDGEKLAFVGDGINDAPVLALADAGIAMGAMGSDAAIEAADIVLMDDDPLKIAKAVKIARKCIGIVYQNIIFAVGIKVLCLILGALGLANMWLAIFADVGVMVIAILNAVRALRVKNL